MPAAGYKLFATGDVLTAAQVNDYLMLQTVMVFANSAARTTALSGVLAEGLVSYLKDTDVVEVYTGAAWVSLDDPNAIQNSIVDAKGDLVAASGADTPARLAVGNNGETLVADSVASTGLRYQGNYAAGKNKIINGDFNIWQRGTTSSTSGYLADRWTLTYSVAPTTFAQSRQTFTPGTAPVAGYEGRYFWRYAITTVGSSTDMYFGQLIEDVTTFAGQTMTFSIYLKADSARSITLNYNQNFGSGGSSAVSASMGTFSVTTAWTRFTATVAIPSISGKTIGTSSYLQFYFTGTPASGFSVDCWGAQAENGSVATAFQTATGTIQGELAACQRYYYRAVTNGTSTSWFSNGFAFSTTRFLALVKLPVQMRVNPTSIETSGTAADYKALSGATNATATSVPTLDTANWDNTLLNMNTTGLTAGQGGVFGANTTNNAYIGFNAEL